MLDIKEIECPHCFHLIPLDGEITEEDGVKFMNIECENCGSDWLMCLNKGGDYKLI